MDKNAMGGQVFIQLLCQLLTVVNVFQGAGNPVDMCCKGVMLNQKPITGSADRGDFRLGKENLLCFSGRSTANSTLGASVISSVTFLGLLPFLSSV